MCERTCPVVAYISPNVLEQEDASSLASSQLECCIGVFEYKILVVLATQA